MTCNLPRPTADVLFKRNLDMFSVTVLGGAPVIPESNEWYVASLNYALSSEFYAVAAQQWRERDPRYACCDNLIEMAAMDGVYPNPAKFAEGYVKVTGVPGSKFPTYLQISFGDKNFRSVSTVPTSMPNEGFWIGRFRAMEPGTASNNPDKSGSITGNLVTVTPGVDSTVTVYGSRFCGGSEAETCEIFRVRYLARKQYKPNVNAEWLKNTILSWPCVTRVCGMGENCCTLDLATGLPTCESELGFYALFDDTFDCGCPPQCVIDEINLWLFGECPGAGQGRAPIGVKGKVHRAIAGTVNATLSGTECLTQAQKNEISTRISSYFKTLCPGNNLSSKKIEAILLQVMPNADVGVTLTTTSPGMVQDSCGGIEVDCGYLPCLGTVKFVNSDEVGAC